MKKKIRIAIYSRKSKYSDKGDSVGNQIEIAMKYIEEHYPIFVKQENISILDEVFAQFPDKLSKTEIEKIAKRINEMAKAKIDGSSSTDA